jgi:hypothetical protein
VHVQDLTTLLVSLRIDEQYVCRAIAVLDTGMVQPTVVGEVELAVRPDHVPVNGETYFPRKTEETLDLSDCRRCTIRVDGCVFARLNMRERIHDASHCGYIIFELGWRWCCADLEFLRVANIVLDRIGKRSEPVMRTMVRISLNTVVIPLRLDADRRYKYIIKLGSRNVKRVGYKGCRSSVMPLLSSLAQVPTKRLPGTNLASVIRVRPRPRARP